MEASVYDEPGLFLTFFISTICITPLRKVVGDSRDLMPSINCYTVRSRPAGYNLTKREKASDEGDYLACPVIIQNGWMKPDETEIKSTIEYWKRRASEGQQTNWNFGLA
jgi:hypothetical protein